MVDDVLILRKLSELDEYYQQINEIATVMLSEHLQPEDILNENKE